MALPSSSSAPPPLVFPPGLLSLLVDLLGQTAFPAQAFWTHADGHLQPLLSTYLATYSPSTAYAYVDTLEFPSPKGFLADIDRQWALQTDDGRPVGSWEHLLGALERSAIAAAGDGSSSAANDGSGQAKGHASRVLIIDHAEGLKFTPGGLGGLLLGLGEMVSDPHRGASVLH